MMLKLRDFLHLPQLDHLVNQLVEDGPGLVILAGIELRTNLAELASLASSTAQPAGQVSISPSGLSAIFSILLQEILLAKPLGNAIIVAEERGLSRVPRQLKRRVGFLRVEPDFPYRYQIDMAAKQRPGLLVIDRLTAETAQAALQAAASGLRVLTQFDTVLHGSAVARELLDLGVPRAQFEHLSWILTTQRIPALCPHCKIQTGLDQDQADRLIMRYPQLARHLNKIRASEPGLARKIVQRGPAGFFRAAGCTHCRGTGYQGDVSVFDLFRNEPRQAQVFDRPSLLSLEEYALHLAAQGDIDLDDLLEIETGHLRRTYHMLTASENALATANLELNRKIIELEASNRVLVQRTGMLMSLEDLGQALISSTSLTDLAARICRGAGDLCGADRVVLYLRRILAGNQETAEILAVRGFETSAPGHQVPPAQVFERAGEGRATRFMHDPPGVRPLQSRSAENDRPKTAAGLRVPLVAQNQLVGVMIVQSTLKEVFPPGEVALLQTFANQAALAIQRAGLVEDLRAKINQLEAAQAELVKKERLERELELAREVQQAMLPHSFPDIPGLFIAAHYRPARQVGGDFYDLFILDDDHFGVVVADVADKGMPAALYMALTRSLLLAEARRESSPRQALMNVNRLLLELGELNGFVSVFYGIVERSKLNLVYARAGHERPMLLRKGQVYMLGGEGAVLGILDEADLFISEESLQLHPGDRLVLYSDGLADVTDETGVFFGLNRLEALVKTQSEASPIEICRAVYALLDEYRGRADQFDDMTLLVLEF